MIFSADQEIGKGNHVAPGELVTKPLNRCKDVKEIYTKHAEKFYHKNAISQAEAFTDFWRKVKRCRDAAKRWLEKTNRG